MNLKEMMETLVHQEGGDDIPDDPEEGPTADLIDAIILLDEVHEVIKGVLKDRRGLRTLIGFPAYKDLVRIDKAIEEMVEEWSLEK